MNILGITLIAMVAVLACAIDNDVGSDEDCNNAMNDCLGKENCRKRLQK